MIRRETVALPVIVATIGNYLGACTTCGLAWAATRTIARGRESRRLERATRLVAKYGAPRFCCRGFRCSATPSSPPLERPGCDFIPFSLWTVAGKALRYLILALIVDAAL